MSVSPDILTQYRIQGEELLLGGIPVSQLAQQHGTPLYLYDRRAVEQRVQQLKSMLPAALSLHYAVKANPFPPLLEHLASLVDGMDVASAGELQQALASGMAADRISFAGPGKQDPELEAAIVAGVILSVESPGELERIAGIGERLGTAPRVAVRVNPAFRLKASGMHMGGGPSPFGIDEEMVPDVLRHAAQLPVRLHGLHVYAGSQNLSATHLQAAQSATFDLAYRLAEFFPDGLRWLNIGGGFGIPYFGNDTRLDVGAISDHLAGLMEDATTRLGQCEVVLELGRHLVGEAGIYVCRVIDRKESRGQVFLITDGGMHQHLAASGNLGQVLRKNFPLVVANRMQQDQDETVSVAGPLCTPLDLLGDRVQLPRAEPGDLVAVLQSGAYGYSASPLRFLSHPEPAQMLI